MLNQFTAIMTTHVVIENVMYCAIMTMHVVIENVMYCAVMTMCVIMVDVCKKNFGMSVFKE